MKRIVTEPPDDPYAGMQTSPRDWRQKGMSKAKFLRLLAAMAIIAVGGVVIAFGALMANYYEVLSRGAIRYLILFAALGVFALAAAVYDVKLFSRRPQKPTVTETESKFKE
jgi:hypothetical protein